MGFKQQRSKYLPMGAILSTVGRLPRVIVESRRCHSSSTSFIAEQVALASIRETC